MKIEMTNKGRVVQALLVFIVFSLFFFAGHSLAQEGPRISMDFKDATLKDVLKIFSQQAGLNFVASEEIEDKLVTLYLDGVTVQDALNSIMEANNLTYVQATDSAVFIVRQTGKPRINMITKVYTLNYARISTTATKAGEGVGGGEAQVTDITTVLEKLLTKGEGGTSLGSIVVDRRTNSIIITSIPEDFPLLEKTIKELDAPTPQALIEAEVVEIQTDELKKLGLAWGNQSTGSFVTFTGPKRTTQFPFIRKSAPFATNLIGGVSDSHTLGTLSLTEFSLVIKALESEGKAKYLAKPRLMVLNNETAVIKISADTAVGLITTESDAGNVTEEAERMETGVILKVTPTINKDDYITMTLEPEVSRVVASSITTSKGIRIYDPTRRTVQTTVMVKDAQTLAIGGLLKSEETDTVNLTPGLGRIPFLGRLFRSDDVDDKVTEIVIFITSYVIRDVGALGQVAEAAIEPPQEPSPAEPPAKGVPAAAISEKAEKEEITAKREAEIEKTVIRLRKKREFSR